MGDTTALFDFFTPSSITSQSIHFMSHTYFIADLHLSAQREDITQCLLTFLSELEQDTDALYVLGDLFEYWLGDDDINAFSSSVEQAFKAVSKRMPIYFIHGNRDFLIRSKFAERAGMTLLPEQAIIDLYGTKTLIMHGDELCTNDVEYQKFRKKARGWWWPRLVLSLPLSTRRKIAENGRKKSKANQQSMTLEIMDVNQQEVVNTMQQHRVNQLIHGHTHRPAIHSFEIDNQSASRIVLGDWYDQGSMLKVSPTEIKLMDKEFT